MAFIPFEIFLAIAFAVAAGDKYFMPGSVPGGFATSLVVGFFGAWIGSATMWHVGPDFEGIPLVASILCSLISVFFLSMVCGGHSHTWE